MSLRLQLIALGKAVQRQIRARKTTSKELSRALGFHAAFLTRALNAHRPLRAEVLFDVLQRLDLSPFEFFRVTYPFGGNRLEAARAEVGQPATEPGLSSFVEIARAYFQEQGPRPSAEYRLRLGSLVKREIQGCGVSIAEVSRRLGLGPSALGQALRGDAQLTMFHVLGALQVVEADPGRVFLGLFLPEVADPIRFEERDALLQTLETIARQGNEGFSALVRQRETAAPDRQPHQSEDEPLPGAGRRTG